MYNTTTGTSITLLITLLFQLVVYERISWYPNWSLNQLVVPALHDSWSAYPAHKIHSYKHLNILVMLLFTSKVASGLSADVY